MGQLCNKSMVIQFINMLYSMKSEDMMKSNEWQNVLWKKRSLHTAIVHIRVNGRTWKGMRRRTWKEKREGGSREAEESRRT